MRIPHIFTMLLLRYDLVVLQIPTRSWLKFKYTKFLTSFNNSGPPMLNGLRLTVRLIKNGMPVEFAIFASINQHVVVNLFGLGAIA